MKNRSAACWQKNHIIGANLFMILITAIAFFLLGSCYYNWSPFYKKCTHAVALISPTQGNELHGIVHFMQEKDGLHISVQLSGVKPGVHALHVHEFGDCACDDALCAGEHYNPTNAPHGGPTDHKRHVGDFGNLIADESGNALYEYVDTVATLNGPYSIIGRSIVVHENADDFVSQPSGNAGARVACGVIGIAKPLIQL